MSGSVMSVNVSTTRGEAKKPIAEAMLKENWGIEGDVHAGSGEKQVSLLAWESVEAQLEEMRRKGVKCPKAEELTEKRGDGSSGKENLGDLYEIHAGDYAENLTVRGIDLRTVKPGDGIEVGEALLEVTRIGKECHYHCAVYQRLGDCVMPREGVFTKVVRGGKVKAGDEVTVRSGGAGSA